MIYIIRSLDLMWETQGTHQIPLRREIKNIFKGECGDLEWFIFVRDKLNGDGREVLQVSGDFFSVCFIVRGCGIRNLSANLRNLE